MNGLLLVDKSGMPPLEAGRCIADPLPPDPRGRSPYPTSHDIVQQVRRLSRQRRIGHTGTLDPMASGLMVLCLGWATRLVEYYQGHDKQYRAEIALGCETDTLDALGKIVDSAPVPNLTIADIEAALPQFRGRITQRPPIYSAIKQEGESLHYRARRGEEVEVPERTVDIHSIALDGYTNGDRVGLTIHCSAGTYIRSLARDLGRALGTRGTLVSLRRTHAGGFSLQRAHTISQIEAAVQAGTLSDLLLAPGDGIDLPTVVIDSTAAERLGHGQFVALSELPEATIVQARTVNGTLAGILVPTADGRWKADKWFAADSAAQSPAQPTSQSTLADTSQN